MLLLIFQVMYFKRNQEIVVTVNKNDSKTLIHNYYYIFILFNCILKIIGYK